MPGPIVHQDDPRHKYGRPLVIATDSEWIGREWISTAFLTADRKTMYVRDHGVPVGTRLRARDEALRREFELEFVDRTDSTDLLQMFHPRSTTAKHKPPVLLLFHYSPKDVEYALGWFQWRHAIKSRTARQHSALTGSVPTKAGAVHLRDLFGWARMGLEKLAKTFGVPMPYKDLVSDAEKGNMMRVLLERPEDFVRYAIGDVLALPQIYAQFVEFVRRIQRDFLGIPDDDLFDEQTIPMTPGRLVAKTVELWLHHRTGEHAQAHKFCDRKLGYLDDGAAGYADNLAIRTRLVRACRTPGQLAEVAADPELGKDFRRYLRSAHLFTALDSCSPGYWASRPPEHSSRYNAIVQGGRCVNERPDQIRVENGFDVDMSGCYGANLRGMPYPVGVPFDWNYTTNHERPTLGRWLAENKRDLLPGRWTATVSGPLSFEQDLLYSKLVKESHLSNPFGTDGDDGKDIPSDGFVLLRREVVNANITSASYEALLAVATEQERREIMNLKVVTAVAYRACDRRGGVAEWVRDVLAASDVVDRGVRVKNPTAKDGRSRAWYEVPLEEFIGRLVDERKRVKKADPKGGLQEVLKLFINTLYGDVASRLFAIGNTVVANNITDKARTQVWMMAKALGLRQTITDGGIYDPSAVPHFRGKKDGGKNPGLDTLSRMWEWDNPRRGRTLGPLPGLSDWPPDESWWESHRRRLGEDGRPPEDYPAPDWANAAARDHIRKFWANYGLEFRPEIEHKRSFPAASYWSKGDNSFLTPRGVYPVLRGKDRSRKYDKKPHPTIALLENIIAGSDEFPADMTYTKGGLLKIGKYLVIQASKGGYRKLKKLRPGDELPQARHSARYNNTYFPTADEKTFVKRSRRKKKHRGKKVPWFEKFRRHGIEFVRYQMVMDDLKDKKERRQ